MLALEGDPAYLAYFVKTRLLLRLRVHLLLITMILLSFESALPFQSYTRLNTISAQVYFGMHKS